MRGHWKRGQKERLSRPEPVSGSSRRAQDAEPGSGGRVKRWRKRDRPEPSVVWQTVAILFVGFAFAAAIGALTVSKDAVIKPVELWILTGAFLALSVSCFLAHWDVNRGRRTKQYETEELPPGDD